MATNVIIDAAGLSKDQFDLIQQFEADYNAVDHFLRGSLQANKQASFTSMVHEYVRKHTGWRDGDLLRMVAEVRNAIVHGKTEPYRYVAMPTPALAQALGACRNRLIRPERAIPKFQRPVETVSVADSLAQVLKLVHQRDYSQFPVYDGDRYRGLLTENGITRWLAGHVTGDISLIDLDEVLVKTALRAEEKSKTWRFVARDDRVDDIVGLFSRNPLLEAVLISASGKESEKLLGIATRWDILQLA
jgi:predicted transcriptional regulator